ncbi:MAG: hypothetical protein ACREBG_14075 [Pyrinomonadaceae bacterium]
MNRLTSDTQYGFKVDLKRPKSELRGVALLGHQTFADLHELISSGLEPSGNRSFFFRFGEMLIEKSARLDDLSLKVGQTFEYVVESDNEQRREKIILEFIDNE